MSQSKYFHPKRENGGTERSDGTKARSNATGQTLKPVDPCPLSKAHDGIM